MVAEIPRSLRQLLRRLPVGHSSVYLNELQPRNQISLLLAYMEAEKNLSNPVGDSVRCLRLGQSDLSLKSSSREAFSSPSTSENARPAPVRSEWVPLTNDMERTLRLPDGSSGRLEAFRPPHLSRLPKPNLFLLAVPRRVLEGPRSLEALLQERLVMSRAALRWRAADGVVLGGLWGCSLREARAAAAAAARGGCRLFLLGRGRQRLLAGEGPALRELGAWCPGAFRSFQIDIRDETSAEEAPHLSGATTAALLEAARSGFAQVDGSGADSRRAEEQRAAYPVLTLAVAEAFVDARRYAAVPWSRVQDDPLVRDLFDALHDPRHFCVTDAVLHASEHIVMPFLIRGGVGEPKKGEKCRLMRWTELRSRLRWRFFESSFGSLSQVLRPEYVTVAGKGLDPFIFPLHDTFISQVLLPSLRTYHKNSDCRREENGMATVSILDSLNGLTSQSRGKNSTPAVNFETHDLPKLVKYFLYFGDYFKVSKDGKNVSFSLT